MTDVFSDDPDQIETARRVAGIVGPASAASQAVADYERRHLNGEDPVCFCQDGSWLVMPRSVFESIGR